MEALSHRSRPPPAGQRVRRPRMAGVQWCRHRRPGDSDSPTSALLALTLATTAAACGGGDDDGDDAQTASTTITVATFNEFGYEGPHRRVERRQRRHQGRAGEGRHVGRRQGQPLHQARRRLRASPTSRRSRATRCPRSWPRSDAFVDLTDAELDGRWLDWKAAAGHQRRRPDDRLRHRHRPGGHLLPRRPVQEGRPADRPRGGRGADGHLGRLLRHRRGVRQEGPRHRVVRLLRRARAGDAQPGREPLRDRRQHRRRREPRARGRLRRPSPATSRRACPPSSPSGATTGPRPSRTTASPPWPAPAGCSASSRATPRASRAGTSPTSSPAAAATGAARS